MNRSYKRERDQLVLAYKELYAENLRLKQIIKILEEEEPSGEEIQQMVDDGYLIPLEEEECLE